MKQKEKQSLPLKEKPRRERQLKVKKLCERERESQREEWKKSCEREAAESSRLRELREN